MKTPCVIDPEPWFSEDFLERREAQFDCLGCPVIDACEQGARERGERYGVWGGVDFTVTNGPRRLLRPKACACCSLPFHPRRGETVTEFGRRAFCSIACARKAQGYQRRRRAA